ncbi:MAG: hypothetical protein IKV10_01990, partial [Alphaproteobacteria bacterium]|nr:hypothetical protein [Alphaproteobacteria bacterium]
AKELEEYFIGGKAKILNELKKLVSEKKMLGKIEERQAGSFASLCLHRDALDEFARLSELKIRRKKTDEWLSAEELEKYFVGGRKKISKELKKLVAEEKMLGKIEERESALCLHRDALDEFARLSGLKRRGKVTPEKFHAGTKVVKAMTQMAESKKQTKDTITPDNQYE